MREKLIELFIKSAAMDYAESAAFFIANGVTIPVHCRDCKHYIAYSRSIGGLVEWGKCRKIDMDCDMPGNGYCCFGERRNNES